MYKKLLPVILGLLLLNNLTKAQMISSDKNRYYEFLVECPIYKCNITGKIIDTALLVAPPNSKFILVDMKQDQCIIRFTMFSNNKKTNNKKSYTSIEDYTSYTYFTITKAQLDFKAVLIKKSDIDLVVGTIITPIKLRFSPFDFSKDISVGSTFGIKYNLNQDKQSAVAFLIGTGISSISVDSFSTHGRTQKSADLLAFTPSIGGVIEMGNAQVGIFLGVDFISNVNQLKYDWIYQGKPWLSFGIGYSMFSFNLKK
jgi:hypothetical protein